MPLFFSLSTLQKNVTILLELFINSLSSSQFYKKVLHNFRGYGLKYVFTLNFLGSIIFILMLFVSALDIKQYLLGNTSAVSALTTKSINKILNQWPVVNYDGNNISTATKTPIFIHIASNSLQKSTLQPSGTIVAIDSENVMLGHQKKLVPIVLTKNKLLINFNIDTTVTDNKTFEYNYTTLLGSEPMEIDQNKLLSLLKNYAETHNFEKIFIYLVSPLIILINFVTLLSSKIFIASIYYFMVKWYFQKPVNMQQAIRLIAFTSGFEALVKPLSLLVPILTVIINFIQLLTLYLLGRATVQS